MNSFANIKKIFVFFIVFLLLTTLNISLFAENMKQQQRRHVKEKRQLLIKQRKERLALIRKMRAIQRAKRLARIKKLRAMRLKRLRQHRALRLKQRQLYLKRLQQLRAHKKNQMKKGVIRYGKGRYVYKRVVNGWTVIIYSQTPLDKAMLQVIVDNLKQVKDTKSDKKSVTPDNSMKKMEKTEKK